MKYVEIKAVEVNNISPDRLEDSVLLAVDETKTKVEEVPSVLRKIEEFKKDQILFGKEMDEIDENLLNEYGLYTVTIQEIKVNWDDGMTL